MATTNKNFKVKKGLEVNGPIGVGSTPDYGTTGQILVSSGTDTPPTWEDASAGGGGISNVVEDTTPQLGGDLDTNGHDITNLNALTFDTSPTGVPTTPGTMSWDPDMETAVLVLDGVNLQIGQEHVIRVKNNSGSVAIPNGTAVMFAGATGDTVKATPAISTSLNEPNLLIGITTEEIPAAVGDEGFGFVTQFGFVNNVDTDGMTLGSLLYVDPATPGLLTTTQPAAPNWTFPVAAVTKVNASSGRILVRIIPGGHLHDVVDVAIEGTPADNELLAYNSNTATWINQTASEAGLSEVGHTHSIANVTDLSSTLDGKANLSGATFTGNIAGINISVTGNVNATTFYGAATGLTNIPGENISGTISNVVYETSTYSDPSWISSLAWSKISSTPNTVSGYGITGGVFTGDIEAVNATFTGNVTVQGELQVIDTTNYSVRDNMIYLNQAGYFDITNAVGNGTAVVYTVPGHSLFAGDYVVVTGIDPSDYNIAGTELLTIDSVATDTITVLKTDTGTYVSGGIVRGKSAANPDLGWAAGRTDEVGYAHTGIFRDATDATYKFFDGYTPEPDESLFIDTSDPSFALAPISVGGITSPTLRLTSTNDVNTTSTTHAFQVGADSGTNLRLDGNEIQVLNNGATGTLFINNEGGPVNIGTVGGSNVVVNGGLSLAQQRNALVVSGYNSASGAFAHANKVIMSANATGSAAPTTRPDGTSLAAGDIWISW